MTTSQNGWPVVGKTACDQGPFQGVVFPNGILAGEVADIARWQLSRYVRDVEPLTAGACWGWYVKPIEGSAAISNHASATAWDINANRHVLGRPASASMSAAQIAACRRIVADSGGVLRWGGDYSGRPDPMHWEIVGSRSKVAAFADEVGSGGSGMLVRKGDKGEQVKFWQYILADLGANPGAIDGDYGPSTEAAVNRSRKALSASAAAAASITGWHAWAMLAAVSVKRAGKPGAPGAPGASGKDGKPGTDGKDGTDGRDGVDGKDGTLTGVLAVEGGTLRVTAVPEG